MYIINKFLHFLKKNTSELQGVNFLLIVTVEEKNIDSETPIRRREYEMYLMEKEFRARTGLT